MYRTIEFNPSAFRHGYTEADIRWALSTHIIDEHSINVFHAMQCRDTFRKQLGIVEFWVI